VLVRVFETVNQEREVFEDGLIIRVVCLQYQAV